jgi:hypothetical protein
MLLITGTTGSSHRVSDRKGTIVANSPVRPARLARQTRLMRIVNVPMRFLLSLPFPTPLRSSPSRYAFAVVTFDCDLSSLETSMRSNNCCAQ